MQEELQTSVLCHCCFLAEYLALAGLNLLTQLSDSLQLKNNNNSKAQIFVNILLASMWDGINLFWMKKVMWSKMQLRVALRFVNLVNPPAMTS